MTNEEQHRQDLFIAAALQGLLASGKHKRTDITELCALASATGMLQHACLPPLKTHVAEAIAQDPELYALDALPVRISA